MDIWDVLDTCPMKESERIFFGKIKHFSIFIKNVSAIIPLLKIILRFVRETEVNGKAFL